MNAKKSRDSKSAGSRLDIVRTGGDATPQARGRLFVAVHRLLEDPRNERRTFAGLEELAESIRSVGLIEPLTVMPATENRFQILTGHRRFRAACMAGLNQVEVVVRDPADETVRRRRSIVSNLQREDVPPLELADALQEMLDEDPEIHDQKQLAAVLGKSPQWVSEMLRILSLPPPLQVELRSAPRPVAADSIAKIARLDDPGRQAQLVTAVVNGATTREVRAALAASPSKPLRDPPRSVKHVMEDGVTVMLESRGQPLSVGLQIASLKALLKRLSTT